MNDMSGAEIEGEKKLNRETDMETNENNLNIDSLKKRFGEFEGSDELKHFSSDVLENIKHLLEVIQAIELSEEENEEVAELVRARSQMWEGLKIQIENENVDPSNYSKFSNVWLDLMFSCESSYIESKRKRDINELIQSEIERVSLIHFEEIDQKEHIEMNAIRDFISEKALKYPKRVWRSIDGIHLPTMKNLSLYNPIFLKENSKAYVDSFLEPIECATDCIVYPISSLFSVCFLPILDIQRVFFSAIPFSFPSSLGSETNSDDAEKIVQYEYETSYFTIDGSLNIFPHKKSDDTRNRLIRFLINTVSFPFQLAYLLSLKMSWSFIDSLNASGIILSKFNNQPITFGFKHEFNRILKLMNKFFRGKVAKSFLFFACFYLCSFHFKFYLSDFRKRKFENDYCRNLTYSDLFIHEDDLIMDELKNPSLPISLSLLKDEF